MRRIVTKKNKKVLAKVLTALCMQMLVIANIIKKQFPVILILLRAILFSYSFEVIVQGLLPSFIITLQDGTGAADRIRSYNRSRKGKNTKREMLVRQFLQANASR